MNHTPILPANQARCRPTQPCVIKSGCLRFQAEIVPGSPLQSVGCPGYVSASGSAATAPAKQPVKPFPSER